MIACTPTEPAYLIAGGARQMSDPYVRFSAQVGLRPAPVPVPRQVTGLWVPLQPRLIGRRFVTPYVRRQAAYSATATATARSGTAASCTCPECRGSSAATVAAASENAADTVMAGTKPSPNATAEP